MPAKKENGKISVCKLAGGNMAVPVVNAVLEMRPSGTTCIAARTNEEVLNIVGLLLRSGLPARQIQTNSDFSLYNLAEIRGFIDFIDATDSSYTVSDEIWQRAKLDLIQKYGSSADYPGVIRLLSDFDETHNDVRYKSDLKQFIRESKLEDFISGSNDMILVSTIHQTKGREFDNVFLVFDRQGALDDATKRAVYVAITRAKQGLHIFCNNSCFDRIGAFGSTMTRDDNDYEAPAHICLQLSHKDVALGYFTYRRREIDKAVSGQELEMTENGCAIGNKQVLKFSAKFLAHVKALGEKGYSPVRAIIRHVVFWKGKDMDDEIKIILPDVEFQKSAG